MLDVARVDIAWLLVCAALVLFMQAGFTALESGLVRSKNSINVAIKNFANFLVASSLFWLFGFGLMFGVDAGGLFGTSAYFFESDSAFLTAFFLFQLGFIATATTLMSGAVAERMRFGGYLVMATFVAAVTYPVFGHWAWGAGVARRSRAARTAGSRSWASSTSPGPRSSTPWAAGSLSPRSSCSAPGSDASAPARSRSAATTCR